MKTVFMYAGQGSQKVSMGMDFYENFEAYRKVCDGVKLSFDHKKLMHEGPLEELSQTENTQGCMAVFAAGVTNVLKEKGVNFDAALGLSLGEYGALYAAGVFDASDYIYLTEYRGRVMAKAAKGTSCLMSAVIGLDSKSIENVCQELSNEGYITLANYNCPGQYVICGDTNVVELAETKLKEAGAKRCIRLNVSGPFHTKYMKEAGDKLKEKLKSMTINSAKIPVVMNVTGDYLKEDDDLVEMLFKQVQSSVHFEESLRRLLSDGYTNFVEIGPGNALSGFLKKTAKDMDVSVNVISIETVEDLKKLDEVEG